MLKLKDIFNIDISSKGGGKLYKKIMRKYNIPLKDVKEVKQEIVECSSGGSGEGVKEYYYKVLEYTNGQGSHTFEIFKQFGIALINTCIFEGNKITYRQYTHNGDTSVTSAMEYVYNEDNRVQAFSFLDIETYILNGDLVGAFPKGTLYDRAYYIVESYPVTEEEKAQMKEMFNILYLNYFQEITKEEYESMITYKP